MFRRDIPGLLDANRRRHVRQMAVTDERDRRTEQGPVGDGEELPFIQVDQQHLEFVTAQTVENVGGTDDVAQPLGKAD